MKPKIHRLEEKPTLKELQTLVGGYIEILYSSDGSKQIIINEEGKLQGLPVNYEATGLWLGTSKAKAQFWHDVIVGDAVVLEGNMMVD